MRRRRQKYSASIPSASFCWNRARPMSSDKTDSTLIHFAGPEESSGENLLRTSPGVAAGLLVHETAASERVVIRLRDAAPAQIDGGHFVKQEHLQAALATSAAEIHQLQETIRALRN